MNDSLLYVVVDRFALADRVGMALVLYIITNIQIK